MKPSLTKGSEMFDKTNSILVHSQFEDRQQPSFIPNDNQNEYLDLWKDFRNDIRKKLEGSNSAMSKTRVTSIERQD